MEGKGMREEGRRRRNERMRKQVKEQNRNIRKEVGEQEEDD